MDITHLGHAAVLVEAKDTRVLIDPGNFSSDWHGLTGLTAILITHKHPDHVDPEHFPGLLDANPSARILVEPSVAEMVGERAEAMAPETRTAVGSLYVETVGGEHAVIHRDLPSLGNVGFVLRESEGVTFFHPGDSLAVAPGGVDVLAAPIYGPWAAMKETVDFVRRVGAAKGFPIHDGLLNDRGWALIFGRLNDMTSTHFTDLRKARSTTF